MTASFASTDREAIRKGLSEEIFDVLVIGGGITGCGIALDAQVRGLKTALIDMQDFAEGTSSRSTKLVHGGLRYLKQFEVKLVAEVGKERAIVYENAPHVTTPVWMLLPIYKNGTFGKWTTSIGLKVYDFLAGVRKQERRSMLNREETLEKEPLLKKEGLLGGGYYVEYRTDDARLTLEVIKEAVRRGAKALNYVKAEELLYDENGTIKGVKAVDQITGKAVDILAKKVVNACGPWVDSIREKDHSKKGKTLHLTKGVHIVFDAKRFPLRNAVYFDTPNGDGRMIFAIPRGGKVYAGTTDTNYHDDPAQMRMTVTDRDYLLEAVNGMFPSLGLTPQDIESSWAGVRPLIHEEGKDPSEISRKDEIFISDSNLITIAGGKLTGYRKMAERTVDLVCSQLSRETGTQYPRCSTDKVPLSGGDFGGSQYFADRISEFIAEGRSLGLSESEASGLAHLYGTNTEKLFEILRTEKNDATDLPDFVFAQVEYGIREEMVTKPVDFFIRRTGALFFNMEWVRRWKDPVINYMQQRLNWDEETKQLYAEQLEAAITTAVAAEE
ncbi:glycerol-3-phosphate dehydrogenase/oxidase [Tuberibacillus calidus]|uniref:glycerol-3-phosphate dehydrogenase/oxidase n=1 Tax=Tuberibacillus calidus TaxID=340097 RepID=UPI0004891997|nr:glycerol-3-phosphate dehydrogenase/oxidase [Tuberibacillus calidus]